MKLTKETLKRMIKEELESMAEATIVNPLKPGGSLPPIRGGGYRSPRELPPQSDMPELIGSIGDKETASGPSDTGHVFVVSKPGDPIWGIFSSEAKVKEFLKGKGKDVDYPYYKYVLDPLSDKGK